VQNLIDGISSSIIVKFIKIAWPFENILNVMIKYTEYLSVKIIIEITKSAGFPDFFRK
jgi:hypothetical protein